MSCWLQELQTNFRHGREIVSSLDSSGCLGVYTMRHYVSKLDSLRGSGPVSLAALLPSVRGCAWIIAPMKLLRKIGNPQENVKVLRWGGVA